MKTDLLVIGGGLAGMSTAIRAAELGLTVRLLEQGEGRHYLCNSRYTGGLFHIGMDDMGSPPDEIEERLARVTGGEGRKDLAKALAHNASRAMAWLRAQGVGLIRVGPDGLRQNSLAPPGVRSTGLNWRWRSGDVMLRTLNARFNALGGQFEQGVSAQSLVMEAGAVCGVRALQNHKEVIFEASVVAICDGGFQGNRALLGQYITAAPEELLLRNAETGKGDGLRMAIAAGAQTVGMDSFYGHIQYREALTSTDYWPYPVLDSLCTAGLLIDAEGNRFCDESIGGVHATNAMAGLAHPAGCHVVIDSAIWNGPGKDWLLPANPFLIEAGGKLVEGASLRELAPKIGLSAEKLEASVAMWNQQVAGKESFSPPRSNPAYKPWPIAEGPFYALPLAAGITYTMGGILTDAAAQVLDASETPISGLLAAGACTGGLEGFSRDGYSGGLSKSATFGMIAGETAATLARAALSRRQKQA